MRILFILVLSAQAAVGSTVWSYDLPNPGFEHPLGGDSGMAWEIQNYGHEATRDLEVRFRGTASLRLDSLEHPQSSGLRHELAVELVRTTMLRMTGYVRSARLDGGASLFVLIDREGGPRHYDFLPLHIVSGNTDWTKLELLIPAIPDATRARVGLMVWGNGSAWFDDLRLEKIDTEAGLSDTAAKYLARALDIMETYSIVRAAVDWPDVRRTARLMASGARETEDTYAALEYAISTMGDGHSHLLRPTAVAILAGDDGAAHSDPVMPNGERLDGRFGYVNVPGFRSTNDERMTRYADALQDLIARLDAPDICGWIVDLRGNLGGNVFPMLAGLGPLLGNGNAGGGVTAEGNLIARSYVDGQAGNARVSKAPYEALRPNLPIAVLIGGRTASSGEATALAFIGREQTRTFGQPSVGATTGNAPYTLSDGAILNLAITKMVDLKGNIYGGKIQPDVPVHSPEPNAPLDAALSWLHANCE